MILRRNWSIYKKSVTPNGLDIAQDTEVEVETAAVGCCPEN